MEQQVIERLIKRLIVKKDYLLLRDQTGEIHLRNDINIMVKEYDRYLNYIQIINGNSCSVEWIKQRLNEDDEVLLKLRQKVDVIYPYTIIVFEGEIDSEKDAYIRRWQEEHLTEHGNYKCFIVNTSHEKVDKLFSRATRDDGLLKILEQLVNTKQEEKWESQRVEELVAKQIEGHKIEYKIGKPFVTYILIAINVLVFLVLLAFEQQTGRSYNELLITYGAKVNDYILEGEYWRLFTAMFLHGGIAHLLVNCYSLFVLGTLVERLFGRGKFIGSYLIAGVLGNIISFMFVRGYSVGASGAIFGLMGMLLYYGIERPVQFKNYFSRGVLITLVINLGYGFSVSGIDNSAHLGGLIGGFLAIGMLSKSEKKKWYTNRILYLFMLIATAVGGLYYGFHNDQSLITRRITELERIEKEQDWEELAQEGKEVLAMAPKDESDQIKVLWAIAKAEIMLGDYEEALSYGKQLTKISPENGYYICGIIYLNMNEGESAIESLKMAALVGNTQAKELLASVLKNE